MQNKVLKVHPDDNLIVALEDFKTGDQVQLDGQTYLIQDSVPLKHKFAARDFQVGDDVFMYGVLVGKATIFIPKGSRIHTKNVVHSTHEAELKLKNEVWTAPDTSASVSRTFDGYHRADGRVGTMNQWLVIPLVFCENRNIEIIKASMLEQLGYAAQQDFVVDTNALIDLYKNGASVADLQQANILKTSSDITKSRLFPNVDGIQFLTHDGGCGGIRQDSETLCRLLASYIAHPNVAGATVLSLGCQNAQIKLLTDVLDEIAPDLEKPLYILEQQQSASEREFIAEAVKQTFIGLIAANKIERQPAGLEHLTIGLECGGSDGFSGISANPTLGQVSDLVVGLGGTTILSEFPELNGVEQEIIGRCETEALAVKFNDLMQTYAQRAKAVGSGFDMNPSPGNIKDGLITDAMKSAGAAKKGGTSPIRDVLDYTEIAYRKGLNLLCTPGNDVESTTGLAGSGANIILFTTGLGTPTGNPITPVIKVASNSILAERMSDIIDFDTGSIISGEETIETRGAALLDYIIEVASGEKTPAAVRLGQHDFIPWKRGVSL
ncbi:MAG: altronate dehydratase family protein [Bacteroidota bacterium]